MGATGRSQKFSPLLKLAIKAGIKAALIPLIRETGLNVKDSSGLSPLMIAAIYGHYEIFQFLLLEGADPWLVDNLGRTAMELADARGFKDISLYFSQNNTADKSVVELKNSLELPIEDTYKAVSNYESNVTKNHSSYRSQDFDEVTEEGSIKHDSEDFSGWEAEDEVRIPLNDSTCVARSTSLQNHISAHRPIDRDFDWSDVDIELPNIVPPTSLHVNLPALNQLVSHGLSAGVVSYRQIHDAILDDYGSQASDIESLYISQLEQAGICVEENVEWTQNITDFDIEQQELVDEFFMQ